MACIRADDATYHSHCVADATYLFVLHLAGLLVDFSMANFGIVVFPSLMNITLNSQGGNLALRFDSSWSFSAAVVLVFLARRRRCILVLKVRTLDFRDKISRRHRQCQQQQPYRTGTLRGEGEIPWGSASMPGVSASASAIQTSH